MAISTAQSPAGYHPGSDASAGKGSRIASLDLARGIVMVLMAIDHVRVYSGVGTSWPPTSVFFTRWVTHFCAPAFVFLAGTAAFLYGQSLGGDRKKLSLFLLTRGALFVALELTLIKFFWTFNLDYSQFVLLGVIWMLGWCMILMAGLVWLPTTAIGIIGLALIFGQPLVGAGLNAIRGAVGPAGPVLDILYLGNQSWPARMNILYVLIPWIGVMAAGYAFGRIMSKPAEERRRQLLFIGGSATAAFLIIAGGITFGNPPPENGAPAIVRMLSQQKYPASALFLLMTLGPMILLLPFVETARNRVAQWLVVFGRVPMFYYLLHIPLIHLLSLATMKLGGASGMSQWYATAPYTNVPEQHRWSLLTLYGVFVLAVAILYPACKWYAARKAARKAAWMTYI
jgi:uncharacterized membrane protein